MEGTIYRCPDCNSTDVEVLEWRNANTGLVGSGGPVNYHCNTCDENVQGLASSEGELPDGMQEPLQAP